MRDKILSASLAWLAFVSVGIQAADPVPKSDQVAPPRAVVSPTVKQAEPPPGVPTPCDVGKFVWVTVEGFKGAVTWDDNPKGIVALYPKAPPGAASKEYYPGVLQGESSHQWHKSPSVFTVPCMGVKEGTVTLSGWISKDGDAVKLVDVTIRVGAGPPDVKPKPDEPDVKPKPDEPDVKPVPVAANPFGTTKGLHVMMTYRDGNLPIGHHNIIYGGTMRDYLNAKCETTDAYRIWKTNTQTKPDDPTVWKSAFARPRTASEWILIGNGTTGYEGPLPATVDETIALIKKYESK